MCKDREREGSSGVGAVLGWNGGWEKLVGLGSELRNSTELFIGIIKFRDGFENCLSWVIWVHAWWVRRKTG